MLNLDSLKKSRVYQEGKEEGKEEGALETKLKMIPRLIKIGLSIEQIAESLEMNVETVRKNAHGRSNGQTAFTLTLPIRHV